MTFSRTFSIITLAWCSCCLPNTKSCPCPPCGPQKSHIYFFWCLCTCLMGYYAPIHGSKVKKSKDMTTTFLFVVVVAICNTSLIHTIQLSSSVIWVFFVSKKKYWCEHVLFRMNTWTKKFIYVFMEERFTKLISWVFCKNIQMTSNVLNRKIKIV